MTSLREIRNRIKSIKSSEKITKAMMMVAASKLRKAQNSVENLKPYICQIENMLVQLSPYNKTQQHPLTTQRETVGNVELLVLTSDKGLCGAFNANVIRKVQNFINSPKLLEGNIRISTFGHRGYDILKREKIAIRKDYTFKFDSRINYAELAKISSEFKYLYTGKEIDELYVVYNEFKSATVQQVTIDKLLPINIKKIIHNHAYADTDHCIYEPNQCEIFANLLPNYLTTGLLRIFFESAASEHSARMTAMDSATKNAKEVMNNLTLKYNRARQAVITNELIEILSGVEAMIC